MAATVYPGPFVLLDLTSTSTGPGTAYNVPPNMRLGGLQSLQTGTSAGVTVTSSCNLQGSNNGSDWADIVGTTLAINGATPQSAALPMTSSHGGWAFIRASLNAGSSTTTASTGYTLKVLANFVEYFF